MALSAAQQQVISLLTQGVSVTEASRETGVPRRTIYNWIGKDKDFTSAVAAIQESARYAGTIKLLSLVDLAVETLRSVLDPEADGETAPIAIRLRAAEQVLDRVRITAVDPQPVATLSPEQTMEEAIKWINADPARRTKMLDALNGAAT